jgi:2-phosphoglycerate kinase
MWHDLAQVLQASNRPVEVLIGGIPGTFKSSTALRLAAELGVGVAGCDELRNTAQHYDKDPILAGETHTRWRLIGGPEHLVDGFLAQARLMTPLLDRIRDWRLNRGEHLVVEGVHVIPGMSAAPAIGVAALLIVNPAVEIARMQQKFARVPDIAARWDEHKGTALAEIQAELVGRARAHDWLILEARSPLQAATTIADELKRTLA